MELIKSDAAPEADDRGRQRDDKQQQQQQQQQQQKSALSEKQVQRSQLEICPSLVSGDRGRERSDPEPKAGDAAGDDGLLAEKTTSRDVQNKRQPGCPGATSHSHGAPDGRQGKKKHRRRPSKKKRRWKPYFKLTWEEKKELDERETARASRIRAEMFAKGLPVAPYNTTQFLMEEHDREEPDLNTELCGRFEDSASEDERFDAAAAAADDEDMETVLEEEEGEGSDGMGWPGHAVRGAGGAGGGGAGGSGGEFLQRDFCETYERYHVETLQNMSKQELVREYLELEKCMSRLEEENNRLLRRARRSAGGGGGGGGGGGDGGTDGGGGGVESAQQRVRELESEVERLRALNGELLLNQQQGLNGSTAAEPEPARESQ
ncbi:protein HEXIM1 [Salminus brasiliensis]|uniref:protein HEXIM1 n=1 Tax=Salminus brasiliensis TaxID=930266 RepID=UPI003B831804